MFQQITKYIVPNLDERTKKKGLLPLCFSLFLGFIAPILDTSVTLVTAKNKHRCWNARYACARESSDFSSHLAF